MNMHGLACTSTNYHVCKIQFQMWLSETADMQQTE